MNVKDRLIQGLSEAGCSQETADEVKKARIRIMMKKEELKLDEMLHQMKVQRCVLIDEMHESQRKVDRMDFLIRHQEKQMK